MLNPTVGRWMEEDPIDFQAGDTDKYRYVGNDATNSTDPSGLQAQTIGSSAIDALFATLQAQKASPNSIRVDANNQNKDGFGDYPKLGSVVSDTGLRSLSLFKSSETLGRRGMFRRSGLTSVSGN